MEAKVFIQINVYDKFFQLDEQPSKWVSNKINLIKFKSQLI